MTEADYPPLRPCPFYGRVPLGIEYCDGNDLFAVVCEDPCGYWSIDAYNEVEAADKWNRRVKL